MQHHHVSRQQVCGVDAGDAPVVQHLRAGTQRRKAAAFRSSTSFAAWLCNCYLLMAACPPCLPAGRPVAPTWTWQV